MNKKAVLISIKPEWCQKIASGEKTLEIRKSKPKLETPFKCYIYCTKSDPNDPHKRLEIKDYEAGKIRLCNGNVIGEFVCDMVTGVRANNMIQAYYNCMQGSCLTDAEIVSYANGKQLYYWHISDLKIYEQPKPLSDFKPWNRECKYSDLGLAIPDCRTCHACKIERPPQSWCFVEDLDGVQ